MVAGGRVPVLSLPRMIDEHISRPMRLGSMTARVVGEDVSEHELRRMLRETDRLQKRCERLEFERDRARNEVSLPNIQQPTQSATQLARDRDPSHLLCAAPPAACCVPSAVGPAAGLPAGGQGPQLCCALGRTRGGHG
jgi:hypothetical protein